MIQDFIGEFMFHPAPLEVSGNTCSHNCAYCFANIRKSCRYFDLKSIIRQLNKGKIVTWVDKLIENEYPICLSNKTDPFSDNNYIGTTALAHHLANINNGVFVQTKGGNGIEDFIKNIGRKNIIWYITITTLNEDVRKRIEPNAPSTDERLKLAKYLKNEGFHVVIATNPLLESWMPERDLKKLCTSLKKIGINGLCMEALHLNSKEVESFTDTRKSAFYKTELEYATTRKHFQDYVKKMIPVAINEGMEVIKLGMPFKSKFFDPIKPVFKNIFPNQYDIINYAHENGVGTYSFDDFYEKSIDDKEFFERDDKYCNKYLLRANINAWKEDEDSKKIMSMKDVLRIIWNNRKYPQSMQRNQAFRVLVDKNDNPAKDKSGNVLLYFDGVIHPESRTVKL